MNSFAFSGESCILSIKKKGGTEYDVTGKIVNVSGGPFERKIGTKKTHGTRFINDEGFQPASVQLTYTYDSDLSMPSMMSYVGSSDSDSNRLTVLRANSLPDFYKIKLQFANYKGTFGDLDDSDEALRVLFYNAYGISNDTKVNADGLVTGVLSFNVNPFNFIGSSNYAELEKNGSTTVAQLTARETAYDTIMGY